MIAVTLILLSVITIPSNAQVMDGGFYDQNNPLITYPNWTWTIINDSVSYFGSRLSSGFTTSLAPEIQFDFFGDGFTWYTIRNSGQTDVNVCVNSFCNLVSLYNATEDRYSYSVSGLGYGTHSVSIKKAVSTNSALNIDAIYIHPPAPQPTVIPPTPIVVVTLVMPTPADTQVVNIGNWAEATIEVEITEDPIRSSWDIDGQDVAFEYRIDTGQVVMTVIQIIMLFIALIILVLFLRGKQAS